MKRVLSTLLFFPQIMVISCGDAGVSPREEPTNEDAIYNIIRYDRPSEFNMDLYNLAVPETLLVNTGPIVPENYWYAIDRDSLFIAIAIRYVQPNDPPGTIPTANVVETKHFWGTLEIIGVDTSGGQNTPVRMSKEFTIVAQISALFEKYGFDYNFRRGWILTQISDAVFQNGYPGAIGSIDISSQSGQDYTVDTRRKPLAGIMEFSPEDSLTVSITLPGVEDFVDVSYRSVTGYTTIRIPPDGTGQYLTGFRLPGSVGFDHFLVDVINGESLTDTTEFNSSAIGVLFRTR